MGNPLLGYWYRMSMSPTAAEKALEPAIARLGERYRLQYPFLPIKYFADFALLDRKLLIEVDGDSHLEPEQKEKDLLHEMQVLNLGWRVVRVTNEQALRSPAEAVAHALSKAAELPSKEAQALVLQDQLLLLHSDYPHLLAAAAKKATCRRQSALVGAETRRKARKQSAPDRAQK